MERDRIIIEKSIVPCTFDILLGDEVFNLTVNYNAKHDFFTVALEKDGETICEGEPLVYGFPLFHDFYQVDRCPAIDIVPIDESGEQNAVTFKNFGETVFLTVMNYDDEAGDVLE